MGREFNVLESAKCGALIPHQFPGPVERSLFRILFDSSGLHQEGGFAGFRVSLGSVKEPASLCPIQGYLSVSSASEEIECPSRQGFEGWSDAGLPHPVNSCKILYCPVCPVKSCMSCKNTGHLQDFTGHTGFYRTYRTIQILKNALIQFNSVIISGDKFYICF